MRLKVIAVGVVAATLIRPGVEAQTSPDFTGKWILVAEKSEQNGASAFGGSFTATQAADALSISRVLLPWGGRRGASPPRPTTYIYKFDGSETNHMGSAVNNRTQSYTFNTTSWSGPRLIILTVSSRDASIKQSIWLEPDGTLVVETTKAGETKRNFYKKTP
jgi:hypothetical protein